MTAYGTHTEFLTNVIKNTSGNIIELGCGDSSTKLIRNILNGTNRKLISVESNKEWFDKYKHLEDENHKLFYVDASNVDTNETGQKWVDFLKNTPEIKDLDFEVCFIDQSPWTARTYTLDYFKHTCPYILIHDADYYMIYGKWGKVVNRIDGNNTIEVDCLDKVKLSKLCYPKKRISANGPPTLFCSNILSENSFKEMCDKFNG